MVPPQNDAHFELKRMLEWNPTFTKYVEIEPKAGCRRFRLF